MQPLFIGPHQLGRPFGGISGFPYARGQQIAVVSCTRRGGHVDHALSTSAGLFEQKPRKVSHVDRLDGTVRTRSEHLSAASHPVKPPRQAPDVFVTTQHDMGAKDQQPFGAESIAARDLASCFERAISIRVPRACAGIKARVAIKQRRVLIDRGMGPFPVDRDRRHEHAPIRDLAEDGHRALHHGGDAARDVDDDIPSSVLG